MATYLERYQNGECVPVWDELIALGDGIRQASVYEDARAVARETMTRTRRNIETLYQRLQNIGYRFDSETPQARSNPFDHLRDQLAGNPLMDGAFGDFFRNAESLLDQFAQAHPDFDLGKAPPANLAFEPPTENIVQQLDTFEATIGKIPLSVRAWCELVGEVGFVGDYPGLASYQQNQASALDIRELIRRMLRQNPDQVKDYQDYDDAQMQAIIEASDLPFPPAAMSDMSKLIREEIESGKYLEPPATTPTVWFGDPLCFRFDIDSDMAHDYMEEQVGMEGIEPGTFMLYVGPDVILKSNFSGSLYGVVLPDAGADAFLHGTDLHFVAYLRESFAWGGFPGLKDHDDRDDSLIAQLKEGLKPI